MCSLFTQAGTSVDNLDYGDPRSLHIQKPDPPDYANVFGSKQSVNAGCAQANNLTGFKYPLTMETVLVDSDNCSQATLSNLGNGGKTVQSAKTTGQSSQPASSAAPISNRTRFGNEVNAYSTKQLVFPSLSAPPSVRPPPLPSDTTVRYHNNEVEKFVQSRSGSQASILADDSPTKEKQISPGSQGPQSARSPPFSERDLPGVENLTHTDSAVASSTGNGHPPLRKKPSPYEIPIDDQHQSDC